MGFEIILRKGKAAEGCRKTLRDDEPFSVG
jgi:hypothetical protein